MAPRLAGPHAPAASRRCGCGHGSDGQAPASSVHPRCEAARRSPALTGTRRAGEAPRMSHRESARKRKEQGAEPIWIMTA
jgi:hypothetical protein